MISAFGVDHGYDEIEKFGLASIGAKVAGKVMGGANKLHNAGAANVGAARAMGTAPNARMGAVKRGLNLGGRGQQALGGQLKKVGGFMAAKPKMAGGLAVGGAGAGVAGAGFGAGRMGGDNKKLSQFR